MDPQLSNVPAAACTAPKCCSFSLLLGRLCIATIFILSGVGKFLAPDVTSAYMALKGMTLIPLFLYSAAIIEIICGLMLVLGFHARWAAVILFLFLIPVTLIFHSFWNYASPERDLQMIEFLKNLAIFGGLLYIMGTGAGKISLDRFFHRA